MTNQDDTLERTGNPRPPSVPFVDLTRSLAQFARAASPKWLEHAERACFFGGSVVEELEKKIEARVGLEHVVACANGTDALILALQAAGVRAGDVVAMPDVTFWATAEAIVNCGATPLLIDIDPGDLQMSFDEFCRAWEIHHFKFAIIAHLFGWASSDLILLRSFCAERGITLIEDGAQAFGVTFAGDSLSASSLFAGAQIATLSFYPAKVLGGCMDGGAVVTRDPDVATICRQLRNHGRTDHYSHARIGWNSRMANLQAIWLLEAEAKIDTLIAERNEALQYYHRFFAVHQERIHMHLPPAEFRGNGYLAVFTPETSSIQEIITQLAQRGIETGRVYPYPIHKHPAASLWLRVSELAVSSQFCSRVINLPLFPGIRAEELNAAAESLAALVV